MKLENQIIKQYQQFTSIPKIAQKYNLTENAVRLILKQKLSRSLRLQIARQIGGRTTAQKLQNPAYRAEYSLKMRNIVSKTIATKMKKQKFREKWLKKAKIGSKKGIKQLKIKLLTEKFHNDWRKKCSNAGNILKKNKQGIFAPHLKQQRLTWSLKGLKRTGKKVNGPNGAKMYNALEVKTAILLTKYNLTYEYEKIIPANNPNGFYSIDFFLPNCAIIEVTYWDKVEEKCKKLNKKLKYLKTKFPEYKIVVVTKKALADKYKRLLAANTFVVADKQLKALITKLTSN